MSPVTADGLPEDGRLGLIPAHSYPQGLQGQKQRTQNEDGFAQVPSLYLTTLLQPSMIDFNPPSLSRRIIQDQKPLPHVHEGLRLLPQRLRVGRRSWKQRVKASWAGALSPPGAHRAASVPVKTFCAAIQKGMESRSSHRGGFMGVVPSGRSGVRPAIMMARKGRHGQLRDSYFFISVTRL
jgi:hypothetical protein